jgi:hypothetical protein
VKTGGMLTGCAHAIAVCALLPETRMTRSLHLVRIALILTTLTTAGCATAAPGLSAGMHAPVGARYVPQPIMPADASLKLDVSAYYVNEPAQVEARIRVQPDPRIRSVTIEWWTDDGVGGSHLISIDGDRRATVFRYPIKRMTEGHYRVAAILHRNDGSSVRKERRVLVIGEGDNMMPTPMISIADEPLD